MQLLLSAKTKKQGEEQEQLKQTSNKTDSETGLKRDMRRQEEANYDKMRPIGD